MGAVGVGSAWPVRRPGVRCRHHFTCSQTRRRTALHDWQGRGSDVQTADVTVPISRPDRVHSGRAVCGRLCLSCHQPVSGRPCQSGVPARARLACGDGRRLAATVLDHGERHTGPDLLSRVQALRIRSDPALLALGKGWPDRFGGLGELLSGRGGGGRPHLSRCAGD